MLFLLHGRAQNRSRLHGTHVDLENTRLVEARGLLAPRRLSSEASGVVLEADLRACNHLLERSEDFLPASVSPAREHDFGAVGLRWPSRRTWRIS